MSDWTTRWDPELTRQYGVEETHGASFEPPVWSEHRTTISLLIPECELQFAYVDDGGEPMALVNRPVANKSIKYWLRFACEMAAKEQAYLSLPCDSKEEVERAARKVAKLLPRHRRVALERMYEATSRQRSNLS